MNTRQIGDLIRDYERMGNSVNADIQHLCDFRRKLIEIGTELSPTDYAKENPLCELTGQQAEHVHHIWGGKQRLDLRSNLIRLSVSAHELCHTEIVQGRCLCMLAKLAKGEFIMSELDAAAGQSVWAWIIRYADHCDESSRLHHTLAARVTVSHL